MSREIRVITAPSIFGKLPALGDFVRHNAPLDQVQAWRSWFDHRDDELLARAASHSAGGGVRHWLHLTPPSLSVQSRLRPSGPCLFILRPCGLQFPSESSYLLGVLAASHDRVGRRYPLVVWQAASAQWAGHILAAPAQWLTDLVQIVHGHTHTADRTGLAAAVDALWARHRPGWRERAQRSLRRLAHPGLALQATALSGQSQRETTGPRAYCAMAALAAFGSPLPTALSRLTALLPFAESWPDSDPSSRGEFSASAITDGLPQPQRLQQCPVILSSRDPSKLQHPLQDINLPLPRPPRIRHRIISRRRLGEPGKHRTLSQRQLIQPLAKVSPRRIGKAVRPLAQVDLVHVQLQDLVLGQRLFNPV
ncbi:conserved hypothetical protein [Cupriavidus necator H16]|uniref:Type VI secretion system-associated protein TagF n=1 Tax=Cupriavidus necator (strain ATCC 17699 / DSM 428 / KCTC 22496 / NCIMB 10442 / H16 / Stanier 337) TaxID=381666 RepID=Q0KDV9_CUPNH|nr:conserved hypothetical protein [Cupriavidus necator H16]